MYAVGAAAESVLRSHFETPLLQGAAVDVRVDDAQLRRAVVALRVLAPNAIRPIEDLVPLLYPGVKVSYGTIQQMLVEAEGRAARFNAQVSLGGVEAGALDEMFSQGEPVLAGVDLDSGYLFGLSLSATRDGEAWAGLLREGQAQGLGLSVVVKDAARGIAAGVSEVFPHAEQRDDCFHVLYEMNKARRRLERRAYARNGPRELDSAVSEIFLGFQAAKVRRACRRAGGKAPARRFHTRRTSYSPRIRRPCRETGRGRRAGKDTVSPTATAPLLRAPCRRHRSTLAWLRACAADRAPRRARRTALS